MTGRGRRVLLLGATGALGVELLDALSDLGFPVESLRPVASEESAGQEVELAGETYVVESGEPDCRGVDLMFCCAPPSVSLEWIAEALRAKVPVIDLSGALAGRDEVPLGVVESPETAGPPDAPLVATPAGPGIAWLRSLLPLHRQKKIRRVVATTLESVSGAGRAGTQALSTESIALFNQAEPPDPAAFSRTVAFDCIPQVGALGADGSSEREQALASVLQRALGADTEVSVTAVQVPTFLGDGTAFTIEFEEPVDRETLAAALEAAPAVDFDEGDAPKSTRDATAVDTVVACRLRPGAGSSWMLWVAGDSLRLAARNAVALAWTRQRLH